MKRITYSPKVWIFIRSSNMNGRIYDVSDDITSGTLTQNLGDVSTASWSLRNRYKKWLRDPVTKLPIFLPMDLVTIWLQRLPGQPIQQFTGYLNSVPYYQGLPADAPFTATCTLKKLAFTWFDPGLQVFQQWLISNGWAYDPTTGQAVQPALNYQTETTNGTFGSTINDGSFGALLGSFMTDVALWDAKDVLISNLPVGIPKAAAKLYQSVATEAEQDLEALSTFLGQAMGVTGWNGTSTSTTSASSTTSAQVLSAMQTSANQYNVPVIVFAYAAAVLTQFNPNFAQDAGTNSGYGIYGLRPDNPTNLQITSTDTIQGYTVDDITSSVPDSSDALGKLLKASETSAFLTGAINYDTNTIINWLVATLGRSLPSTVDPASAILQAKQFVNASIVVQPTYDGMPVVDPSSISWQSLLATNLLTAQEQKVANTYYTNSDSWLAALIYQIKYLNSNLRLASTPSSTIILSNDQIFISGSDGDLNTLFSTLQGDTQLDAVQRTGTTGNGQSTLRNGQLSTLPIVGSTQVSGVLITQSQAPPTLQTQPPSIGTAGTTAQAQSTQNGEVSFADLAAFSATSAFAANFSFPTDIIESTLLTGEKALMNDTSCLDAVQQFAAASLRTFKTLPDGRFLAFYPDYFGAHRDPYWKIENIELVDFGIILNDEQLATHVYVTGDTVDFNDQIDFMEMIGTAGVATITQAGMLSSFIEPWSKDPTSDLGRLADTDKFLQHYGARPYSEEQPVIRNTAYEFLFAWQRFMQKWAQQFSTTVDVTFQPEVMAGGLISFPDHGVQMFVESVTHSWDYSSGFNTTAVLTAPSIPKHLRKGAGLPGFALGGSINSVGAAS